MVYYFDKEIVEIKFYIVYFFINLDYIYSFIDVFFVKYYVVFGFFVLFYLEDFEK